MSDAREASLSVWSARVVTLERERDEAASERDSYAAALRWIANDVLASERIASVARAALTAKAAEPDDDLDRPAAWDKGI